MFEINYYFEIENNLKRQECYVLFYFTSFSIADATIEIIE